MLIYILIKEILVNILNNNLVLILLIYLDNDLWTYNHQNYVLALIHQIYSFFHLDFYLLANIPIINNDNCQKFHFILNKYYFIDILVLNKFLYFFLF